MARLARFFTVNDVNDVDRDGGGRPLLRTTTIASQPSRSTYMRVAAPSGLSKLKERDDAIARRNLALAANVVVSLTLMFVMMQLEWTGKKLEATHLTQSLKTIISILTIVQLAQTVDYYIMEMRIKMEEASDSNRVKYAHRVPPARGVGTSLRPRGHLLRLRPSFFTVWNNSKLRYRFWVEILLCIPHPLPYVGPGFDRFGSLFMLVRLYILLRVVRDRSLIYRKRASIKRIPGYSPSLAPTFSTYLSLKMFFYQYPIFTVVVLMVGGGMLLGYGIYIFEREEQPELFGYPESLYLSISCMLTGYPTDAFEKYTPFTVVGKAVCIGALIWGLFLFALLIDYVHRQMRPDSFEEKAVQWVQRTAVLDQEREECARLIQLVWRHHKWEQDFGSAYDPDDAKYLRISKVFESRFMHQTHRVRDIRRRKADLGIRMDATQPAQIIAPPSLLSATSALGSAHNLADGYPRASSSASDAAGPGPATLAAMGLAPALDLGIGALAASELRQHIDAALRQANEDILRNVARMLDRQREVILAQVAAHHCPSPLPPVRAPNSVPNNGKAPENPPVASTNPFASPHEDSNAIQRTTSGRIIKSASAKGMTAPATDEAMRAIVQQLQLRQMSRQTSQNDLQEGEESDTTRLL